MRLREYRCAGCGGTFTHELRGRPRVSCEACAPARKRAQIREWDRQRSAEQRQQHYVKQRARAIERAAAWNKANPERRREIARKYDAQDHVRARARLRNYNHESRGYAAILAADPCCYCGAPSKHIDHIEPVARGGMTEPGNLTAACTACNVSKSAHPLLTFLLSRR